MSRREWYFWGWVLWLTFGLIGMLVVLAPFRMGMADPPAWWGLVLGFVGGLLAFIALNVYEARK